MPDSIRAVPPLQVFDLSQTGDGSESRPSGRSTLGANERMLSARDVISRWPFYAAVRLHNRQEGRPGHGLHRSRPSPQEESGRGARPTSDQNSVQFGQWLRSCPSLRHART